MTYDEYLTHRKEIERKHDERMHECERIMKRREPRQSATNMDWMDYHRECARVVNECKGRYDRSIKRLAMSFASQQAPVKVGDLIWAGSKLLKVESMKLAAFSFPMLTYGGTWLTLHGVPMATQPAGRVIYQKDITSINGVPFKYTMPETTVKPKAKRTKKTKT